MRVYSHWMIGAAFLGAIACSADTSTPAGEERPTEALDSADAGTTDDAAAPTDAAGTPDAAPICAADLGATVSCGRCGSATQTCVAGKVVTSACTGETGACVPNDTATSAGACQVRTCTATCQWGPWMLSPGAQCAAGQTWTCNAGVDCPRAGTKTCLPTCQWGPCKC